MADLDDFFAKKDRKKAKGKRFTTTEEIAKKLEETAKKVEKPKAKEKPVNTEGGEENPPVEVEDEWKDFEEEKKDYTGLKIGNLTVASPSADQNDEERGPGENGSDGESGEAGGKHSGPWKKTAEPEPPAPAPEVVPEPKPAAPAAPAGGGAYRIPQARNPQRMDPQRPVGRRMKNVAPDISSEEYFPTLNAKAPQANDAAGAWGKKKTEGNFEEVKNQRATRAPAAAADSAQAQSAAAGSAGKVALGNKYGALEQDQS